VIFSPTVIAMVVVYFLIGVGKEKERNGGKEIKER
jgi:hypothetical protein